MSESRDYVRRNQAAWGARSDQDALAAEQWAAAAPSWGVFNVPDADVAMMPSVAGRDVLELGCGTAYASAWVARAGGRPVGVDLTASQLAIARRFQSAHGVAFPLVQADGERVPLADGSFDVVLSEYGACLWCDPYRWVPEAARLLRPGGELVFLTNSVFMVLCVPDTDEEGPVTDRLLRPYFGMHRFEWPGEEGVDFHLGYGDWIRVLRANGFVIDDMIEVRPRAGEESSCDWADAAWAQRWPIEEIWKATKLATA